MPAGSLLIEEPTQEAGERDEDSGERVEESEKPESEPKCLVIELGLMQNTETTVNQWLP